MLSLVLGLFSQQIIYQSNYTPHFKEIVVEEEILPPLPLVVLPEKKKEYNPVACSCIIYASQFIDLPKNTDAIDLISNSQPYIGGAILLKYGNLGHIAIIIDFKEDGFLVKESNYKRCEYTTRLIPFDDKHITGFMIQ